MKIQISFIIFISLALLSCNKFKNKEVNQDGLSKKVEADIPFSKKSLADSLKRFSFLDEFTKRDDSSRFVLYGKNINGINIGIIALTDSTLFFYQGSKKKPKLTDSIKFDTYAFSFETTDLNGDNNDDFIIHSVPDIHGQTTPFVFLFQKDNLFHYRPDLQLRNIRYNRSTKRIESYYESCAFCIHSKAIYQWSEDSLKLLSRAELDMTSGEVITTRIFKIKNGLEKKILEVKDNEQIFDTVLFRIDDCY